MALQSTREARHYSKVMGQLATHVWKHKINSIPQVNCKISSRWDKERQKQNLESNVGEHLYNFQAEIWTWNRNFEIIEDLDISIDIYTSSK